MKVFWLCGALFLVGIAKNGVFLVKKSDKKWEGVLKVKSSEKRSFLKNIRFYLIIFLLLL
ncbi:hypothetical protein BZL53_04890 [Flavobacterium columnare]|nr:hypothetical protein BZL53_04890 [Flavobacterium columnare]